jgi:hypothetical protein
LGGHRATLLITCKYTKKHSTFLIKNPFKSTTTTMYKYTLANILLQKTLTERRRYFGFINKRTGYSLKSLKRYRYLKENEPKEMPAHILMLTARYFKIEPINLYSNKSNFEI